MKIYHVDLIRDGLKGLPENFTDTTRAVGLGFFDGVHRGHQELLRALVYHAKRRGMKPVVFTFDRYPKQAPTATPLTVAEATAPEYRGVPTDSVMLQSPLPPSFTPFPGLLQPLSERIRIMEAMGIEELILQAYNEDFVQVEAADFAETILGTSLHAGLLVTGEDYRFGKARGGDVGYLRSWGQEKDVEVITVPPVLMDETLVSSTLIREHVAAGHFETVRALMGRPFSMQGIVIRGNALGRTVGMPTANIRVPEGLVVPPYGVYLTRTIVGETSYPSVTNIGMRPTVNQTDPCPLLETCLLDVDMDLYGKLITVEFIEYMRPEIKYPSFLAMTAQIHDDIQDARRMHRSLDQPWRYTTIHDNIPFYIRNSERFGQCTLDIVFQAPATAERMAYADLLTRVMTASARGYETRTELAAALDYQYGAIIDTDVLLQGDLLTVTLHCSAVRRGIDGTRPFLFTAQLLCDMLVDPLLEEDGSWPSRNLETERQNLLMEMRAREGRRSERAIYRAWTLGLDDDEPRALDPAGRPDLIRNADSDTLHAMREEMLHDWQIKVYAAGDVKPDARRKIRHKLEALPVSDHRFRQIPGVMPSPYRLETEHTLRETSDGEQAELVMIYSGIPPYPSLLSLGVLILNKLIGGGPHSRLYETVREQRALAYTVDSTLSFWDEVLVVSARLYPDDVDAALAAIREEIQHIADGQVSEWEFVSARLLAEADLLASGDNLLDMAAFMSEAQTSGRELLADEVLSMLRSMDLELIIQLARGLTLRTTYVRLPEEETA